MYIRHLQDQEWPTQHPTRFPVIYATSHFQHYNLVISFMEGQELLTSDKSGKFITLIKVVSSTPRHGLEVNSVAQLLR